jgi:hypothetical protein
VHPGLRTLADGVQANAPRVLAGLAGFGLLALLAARLVTSPAGLAAGEPVRGPDWANIERPHRAFALAVPASEEAAPRYLIRRHVLGGGRKDVIGWGDAASATPVGMVEIYRPGSELESFADAPTEIAARTSDLGAVGPATLLGTMDSKFGPLSLVEFAAHSPITARNCLGFVRIFDEPRLQISGWYCNAGPEIVDRGVLACALDRLTLEAAGGEPKVAELFARAETRRTFCGKKSPLIAATPRRPDWIEAASHPKLRGRLVVGY